MKKLVTWILGAFVFILAFGGGHYAHAAVSGAVDPTTPPTDVAQLIYNAFTGGHYAYAAALALILAVGLVKRYSKWDWLHTDAGHAVFALVGSSATAVVAGLAGGGPMTFGLAEASLAVGVGAAGGYKVLEALVIPYLKKLQAKAPQWLQRAMQCVLFIWNTAPAQTNQPDPVPGA